MDDSTHTATGHRRLFLLLVFLFLGTRALILWTDFDSVSMPNYEHMPMGNLATALSTGMPGPGITHYYDNGGGHLIVGLMAAPLYWIFGDYYLVLKLVPILLGVFSMWMIWKILTENFNVRSAVIANLLFVFGPTILVKYSMLAKGNHFECLAPQLLTVYLFFRCHRTGHPPRTLFFLGMTAGFGVLFYMGALLWTPLLFLVHFVIRGWKKALLDLRFVAAGFLVGVGPLLMINALAGGRVSGQMNTKFVEGRYSLEQALGRLQELVEALPVAPAYRDWAGIPGTYASWFGLVVFTIAWGIGAVIVLRGVLRIWSKTRDDEGQRFQDLRLAPFVLYLPVFAAAWAFGKYRFDVYHPPVEVGTYRYLVTHYMVVTLLVGAVIGSAKRFSHVLAGVALLPALVLPGLVDWSFDKAGTGWTYPGHDSEMFNNALMRDGVRDEGGQLVWDAEWLNRMILEFDQPMRHEVARGCGHHLMAGQLLVGPGQNMNQLLRGLDPAAIIAPYDEALHLDLARGMGVYLLNVPPPKHAVLKERLAQLHAEHPEIACALAEGMGAGPLHPLSRTVKRSLDRSMRSRAAVPPVLRGAWEVGRGQACGRLHARGFAPDIALAEAATAKVEKNFRVVHDVGLGRGWIQIETEEVPHFFEGLGKATKQAFSQGALAEAGRRGERSAAEALFDPPKKE